jgi:hypothetical protein
MPEQLPHRKFETHKPDIAELYERVEVPTFHSFRDVNDARLQNRINRFFADIIQPLQLNDLMQAELLEYKEDAEPDRTKRVLSLQDFQVLATVTSTKRADIYDTVADKKPLAPATIVAIQGYHEGDNFLTDILFRRPR